MTNDYATQSQKAKNSTDSVVDDPKTAIDSAINAPFENGNIARETYAEKLKRRSEEASALTQRAEEVFSDFNPSRFSSDVLEGPNYLRPSDNLADLQNTIINKGLESIQESNVNHSMRFVENDEIEKLGTSNSNGTRIKLNDLIPYIDSKLSGRQLFVKESVISSCKAKVEFERRLQEILASKDNTNSSSNGSDPASKPQSNSNGQGLSFLDITSDTLVKENVGLQMATAKSPESELQYLPVLSKQIGNLEDTFKTFQLRSSPSDVTSYHDFHNLQIAFQSIWTEMFDGQLGDLGKQLFIEYVKIKQFLGVDDETDSPISTLDDLKELLGKIKEYAQQITPDVPSAPISGTLSNGGGNGNIGTDVAAGAIGGAALAPFVALDPITGAIMGALIAAAVAWDPFKRNPSEIVWKSFETFLPHHDFIEIKIEEGVVNPSVVQFVLKIPPGSRSGKILEIPNGVSNNPQTAQLWVQDATKLEDSIALPVESLKNGQRIVFFKPSDFGAYRKFYSLGELGRIKPGTRVTFYWVMDDNGVPAGTPMPGPMPTQHPWPFPTPDLALTPPAPASPPLSQQGDDAVVATENEILAKTSRLYQLLHSLEKLLSERQYAFDVFAKDSINFGILVTYRQKWQPVSYQVGDLVSTIPLAPKEIRRYTTKVVTKKTRAVKEIENSLQIRKKDSSDTSRVDAEIVKEATNKTNFTITAEESFGGDTGAFKIGSTQSASNDQSKMSRQVKKDFRESVLKSAEEYKQEHRMEIDTSESQETEATTFHEIQNPNDELAVTYLFYELQRTYRISEKIHKITPVILVANDVPSPNQINDAWLLQHDWILKRVLLDDSFRPALEYLLTSFVGAEINIRLLQTHVEQQKSLVERQGQQVQLQNQILARALEDVKVAIETTANKVGQQGILDAVKSIFDPAGLIKGDIAGVEASQMMADYTQDTLARAEKEKARLEAQLEVAVSALQVAIDKFSTAVKEHYNRLVEIDRLRLHIKDNILYYMQAIWNHEPPDQRFFRLYDLDVKIYKPNDLSTSVSMSSATSSLSDFSNKMLGKKERATSLPTPTVSIYTKKLADIADLNNLLGYKGNYMMFPLTENNYLTLYMMQDYLEIGDDIMVRDPDEYGNFTLDEIQEFATCVYQNDRETFNEDQFKKIVIDRLTSSRKENELVIVPTTSLYIEALVGTHPLLEDFKLIHRALDVKKVQAEVRHAELENIRLAARALESEREDPDIEKKIVIENGSNVVIDTE